MNEFNSINHEPRTPYLPVISSGRLGRAPISNPIFIWLKYIGNEQLRRMQFHRHVLL